MILKNKVGLVTGGNGGLGRAIVLELISEGATVAFTFFNNKLEAEELVNEIERSGGHVLALHADVRNMNRAKEIIDEVKSKFGRIDFLVNNAGMTKDKALMLMDEEDWRDVIDTNLTGTFNYTRASVVTFMKQRFGRIVNVTSVSGVIGISRQTNYSASKAGIIGFTKALAKELAEHNITVNAIAPGFIDTGMTNKLTPEYRNKILDLIPQKRFGTTKEVAKLTAFLLGESASYILGQVIVVDGGFSL